MVRISASAYLATLVAAAAFTCGSARAQQSAYITPLQPSQMVPQDAAPSPDSSGETDELAPRLQKQIVDYPSREATGTIIIDTPHTFLYYVLGNDKAIRYGIGVGRQGFTWSGVQSIVHKTEWPGTLR